MIFFFEDIDLDKVIYILNNALGDDSSRLLLIDKMIEFLKMKKKVLERDTREFYDNKNKFVKDNYNRIFKRYILTPTIIFSGFGFGIIEILPYKVVDVIIFGMTFFTFLFARKIIPQIKNYVMDTFSDQCEDYFNENKKINELLQTLYNEKAKIMVDSNKEDISIDKKIDLAINNTYTKPYARIKKW